ncbi:MAG: exodeoxyribonuclease VII large subunit [Acidimicrobiales bacterium]
MTVPLFDDETARQQRRVTLVRLAAEIARSLAGVGRVAVEGEVYRPTMSRGGWVFFTLRDRAAQIEVRVPAANARRCRAVAGERVCVSGNLQWANDRGQVHLVAEEVTPVGAGAIAALIAETRLHLAAEGLLDRPRRRIPALPARIGVVCGTEAAVRRDIESVVAARFPAYPVHFEETTVSGPGASVGIVDALQAVVQYPGVEVVVLARGGGDGPSLLPWSSEEVCRAVAACPVPVVSAIGHEGDRPLCDEVADLRCGTPSLAATAVVPDLAALLGSLDRLRAATHAALEGRLATAAREVAAADTGRAVQAGLERAGSRLVWARQRLGDVHPSRRLGDCRRRLDAVDWRRPAGEVLGRAAGRLAAEERHLDVLSPRRTLERGYAVVTGPDGSVLRRAASVRAGDPVEVHLSAGSLAATVTEVRNG